MATKRDLMSFEDKQHSSLNNNIADNSNERYSNINLNQNNKCSDTLVVVQSHSKSFKDEKKLGKKRAAVLRKLKSLEY
jgi:hypothetical protein